MNDKHGRSFRTKAMNGIKEIFTGTEYEKPFTQYAPDIPTDDELMSAADKAGEIAARYENLEYEEVTIMRTDREVKREIRKALPELVKEVGKLTGNGFRGEGRRISD